MRDMATKKRWSNLTGQQRAAILVAASVELALTATALVDLIRRLRSRSGEQRCHEWGVRVEQVHRGKAE